MLQDLVLPWITHCHLVEYHQQLVIRRRLPLMLLTRHNNLHSYLSSLDPVSTTLFHRTREVSWDVRWFWSEWTIVCALCHKYTDALDIDRPFGVPCFSRWSYIWWFWFSFCYDHFFCFGTYLVWASLVITNSKRKETFQIRCSKDILTRNYFFN